MNKYLKFADQHTENSFRSYKISQFQFRVFTFITLAGLIILLTNIFTNFKDQNNLMLTYIKIGISVYIFIQGLLIYNYRRYTNEALFAMNLIIIISEIKFQSDFDVYDGYLMGSNSMLTHTILSFTTSLTYGVVSTMILCCSRLAIVLTHSQQLLISQYFYTILITILTLIVQYQAEKFQREFYLLIVKGNSLDIILPNIIKQQFCVFSMDKQTMKLQTILHNLDIKASNQEHLKEFLQIAKFRKQQLSTFIYKLMDKMERSSYKSYQLQFIVNYNKKKELITFQYFKLTSSFYTITLDGDDDSLNQIQIQQEKQCNHFAQHYKQLALVCGKLFTNQKLYQKSREFNYKINISLLQVFMLTNQEFKESENIYISQIMKRIIKLVKKQRYYIQVICPSKIKIKTNKVYFISFLLEICKNITRNNRQIFTFSISEERIVTLEVRGMFIRPQNIFFDKCEHILVDSTNVTPDSYVFKFNKDPIISFNQSVKQ